MTVPCPDCKGDAELIGPIPATDMFAGRMLERPYPGGALFRCRKCLLGFRWPRPNKDQLDALYVDGSERAWRASLNTRPDWQIAHNWVREHLSPDSRILDLGCFDGGFFERLIDSYRCFGIEIHSEAYRRAEQKGVQMVGREFSRVGADCFDCITAFDVIEHVHHPRLFLVNCLAAIKPRGWLIVSTGNLDAVTFRLMGSRYWYCTIAEHISFASAVWFNQLTEALGVRIVKQVYFSHSSASLATRLAETTKNLLYRTSPSVFAALRMLGMGGKKTSLHAELADHPPRWLSARDHLIVLVQK